LDVSDQLVTCCYLVIAAAAGEVTICSAGHLPTLIATPGDGARALPAPVNAPLGVGDVLYQQSSTVIPPGATLVLYTDGLIETPGSDIEDQLAQLTTTLSDLFTTIPDLEAVADHVLAALLPEAEGHNDDVTLLLTRLPDVPLATVTTNLPAIPDSVPEGRAFLGKALTSWDCTEAADDAPLLLSEILTNAVQYAQGTHRPARLPHRHRADRRGQRPQPASAPTPPGGRGRGIRSRADSRPRPRRQLGCASHRRGQDHLVHPQAVELWCGDLPPVRRCRTGALPKVRGLLPLLLSPTPR
jgi:hypothetical protein